MFFCLFVVFCLLLLLRFSGFFSGLLFFVCLFFVVVDFGGWGFVCLFVYCLMIYPP